jgi:putative transposase
MYRWRRLTDEERVALLLRRKQRQHPPHSAPHVDSGARHYLITAACYEHAPHIGFSEQRMESFAEDLLDTLEVHCAAVTAWVVLPNHYHALVHTDAVLELLAALGKLHGRSSFTWNGEEGTRGRQVWCGALETAMKSDAHYHATVNYVLNNAVKHGYVSRWTDWPWSNAPEYLQAVGREEAAHRWRTYPVDRMGDGWDESGLEYSL